MALETLYGTHENNITMNSHRGFVRNVVYNHLSETDLIVWCKQMVFRFQYVSIQSLCECPYNSERRVVNTRDRMYLYNYITCCIFEHYIADKWIYVSQYAHTRERERERMYLALDRNLMFFFKEKLPGIARIFPQWNWKIFLFLRKIDYANDNIAIMDRECYFVQETLNETLKVHIAGIVQYEWHNEIKYCTIIKDKNTMLWKIGS